MSVPLTLLGLLERGPSHGYDLKRDYDAYFGRGRPLRYSQVYATLSRLARDGKTVPGPVEQEAGPERRRYVITEAGAADVERGVGATVPPEADLDSQLFAKGVPALLLGRPAGTYLDVQRAAHLQRMRELTELKRDSDQLGVLLADHALYRLEADLRWIDPTAARLDPLGRRVHRWPRTSPPARRPPELRRPSRRGTCSFRSAARRRCAARRSPSGAARSSRSWGR